MRTPRDATLATPSPTGTEPGVRLLDEGAPLLPRLESVPARQLNGMDVVSPRGRFLGRIADVIIDIDDGVIAYALLATCGDGAPEPRCFAVPWTALRIDPAVRRAVLHLDPETLARAPGLPPEQSSDAAGAPGVHRIQPLLEAEATRPPCPRPSRNGRSGRPLP